MKKNKSQKNAKKNYLNNIWYTIENAIYYIILIPLIIITLMIVYQQIKYPEKIPDIFGYKLFIIMDENMDDSIKYGDLVITKNIDSSTLKTGNVIAFRNASNTVTLHKIIEIEEKKQEKNSEEILVRTFKMKALENETNDTKKVKDSKVEGLLEKRIPMVRFNNFINTKANSSCIYNRNNFISRINLFIYCKKTRFTR